MPPSRTAFGSAWRSQSLLILLATSGGAVREEALGSYLDDHAPGRSGRSNKTGAWTNSSLLESSGAKLSDEQVPGGALAVAIAEAGIVKGAEVQARLKAQAMVCAEHIVLPPGPVEVKPEWLYGVGCALDNGHMCRCPWRVFYGCQRTGMFGLPGGVTTDIVQKMGFCRIEAWIFIIPPVLLLGAAIVFMPSSSTTESRSSPAWVKGVNDEVNDARRNSKSEDEDD